MTNHGGGKLIVFEGGEGMGKGTQIERLRAALAEAYGEDAIVVSAEPGGGIADYRQKLFDLPMLFPAMSPEERNQKELNLFIEDRTIHVRDTLWPAVRAGKIVLEDRFCYSTVAYQGFGKRMNRVMIDAMNARATKGLVPDLIILLHSDFVVGLIRKYAQAKVLDRFEKEGPDFHERVCQGYLAQAFADPDRWVVIDASRDIDTIAREIRDIVKNRLGI